MGEQLILVHLLVHHVHFPVRLNRGLQRRPHAGHHRGLSVSETHPPFELFAPRHGSVEYLA